MIKNERCKNSVPFIFQKLLTWQIRNLAFSFKDSSSRGKEEIKITFPECLCILKPSAESTYTSPKLSDWRILVSRTNFRIN